MTGTNTALGVLGADDGGESNLTYNWSVTAQPSGVTTPTFSINGTNAAKNSTATFYAAGSYTFMATITDVGGQSVTSSVSVTVSQTQTGIGVSPTSVTLAPSGTQQFTASALDQFGRAMAAQPSFTWSLDAGGVGTISTSGLYTAPSSGSGSATVRATAGSSSGTASVTVTSTPNPPSNLQAAAITKTRIDLSWTDNSGNETGFKIQRFDDGGSTWSQIATVGQNVTTYSDRRLAGTRLMRIASTRITPRENRPGATSPPSRPRGRRSRPAPARTIPNPMCRFMSPPRT